MVDFTGDLALILNELGSATVGGSTVAAVYDNGYADELGIAGARPSLVVATDSVVGVTRGTAVVANGTSYLVAGIEPDGTGITRLILETA